MVSIVIHQKIKSSALILSRKVSLSPGRMEELMYKTCSPIERFFGRLKGLSLRFDQLDQMFCSLFY